MQEDRRSVGSRDLILYAVLGMLSLTGVLASIAFARWADAVEEGTRTVQRQLTQLQVAQAETRTQLAVMGSEQNSHSRHIDTVDRDIKRMEAWLNRLWTRIRRIEDTAHIVVHEEDRQSDSLGREQN